MTKSTTKADRQFIEVLRSGLQRDIDDYYAGSQADPKGYSYYDCGKNDMREDLVASIDEYLNETKNVDKDVFVQC